MTPSWYDVLDVDPTADPAEIRSAWTSAIVELEPTDRRFRLLNQAAEVLLDPARRAEHDRALAADVDPDPAPDAGYEQPAGPSDATPVGQAAIPSPPVGRAASPGERRRDPATDEPTRWAPPIWLLAGVAVLVAVLVGAAVYVARTPTDASIQADTRSAQSSAEEAAVAILSYDYRDMDASRTAASAYLTSTFRRDYDALFAQLEANADAVKPVVSTEVVSSGIQRVNADGDRVSVLVFVNRPTVNAASATPTVYQDFVTMRMQLTDGQWLVDDMITTPPV